MTKELEACPAVYLPHDPLRLRVHALGTAIVERQGQSRLNGRLVEVETAGEGLEREGRRYGPR